MITNETTEFGRPGLKDGSLAWRRERCITVASGFLLHSSRQLIFHLGSAVVNLLTFIFLCREVQGSVANGLQELFLCYVGIFMIPETLATGHV